MSIRLTKRILLFCLCIYLDSFSQILPSNSYTVNDGLPSNSIKSLFKDSRGVLWVGTESGLCSFDGDKFLLYNESNGFKTSHIWSIVEDKDHNLWMSLYGEGIAKYDGKKFTYFSEKDGLVNNFARKLYYSNRYECLIVGTEKGVSIFNGEVFKSINKIDSLINFQITGISEDDNGVVITSSRLGVFDLLIQKKISESSLKLKFKSKTLYSSLITDSVYIGGCSDYQLYIKDLKTKVDTLIKTPSIIWDFVKADNDVYFTTWNVHDPKGGVYRFKDGEIDDITQKAKISANGFWCLLFDKKENKIWVGSIDKGLYSIDVDNTIQLFPSSYFSINDFSNQEIFQDKNSKIWIGGKDNICVLNQDNSFVKLDEYILWMKLKRFYKKNNISLSDKDALSSIKKGNGFNCFNFHSDNIGNTWINTTWGLFCFNQKLDITFHKFIAGGFSIFDKSNKLYYGIVYSTILKFDSIIDWGKPYLYSLKNLNTPRDITKVKSNGDIIWFGTAYNGLFTLKNGKFSSLLINNTFKEKTIVDIEIIDSNRVIVASNRGNVYTLSYVNNKLNILYTLNLKNGIIGNSISFIEYYKGLYLIGTNQGVNFFKNGKFIKIISHPEGLTFKNAIINRKGILVLGTNDGIIKIDINSVINSRPVNTTPIEIYNLKINGIESKGYKWGVLLDSIFEFNYRQNDIELFFKAVNLSHPSANQYRFKVDGLSDKWSSFDREGHLQLFGLHYGNYKLILEGKNISTGEVFQMREISLKITPPYWKTLWFVSLIAISFIIGIYFYIKWRTHKIRKQENEKRILSNKIIETRLEALRAQMNPHFTFNAINSIQNFIIDADTKSALMYLGEFSKLIRQTLETASEKLVSVHQEIDFLKSYILIQQMRFEKVQVNWEIDSELDLFKTKVPSLILQPFIENVFEHAFDNTYCKVQKLDIIFQLSGNVLTCIIKDNGIGLIAIKPKRLHQSKGQQLTRERLELLNKEYNTHLFHFTIDDLKSIDKSTSGTEVRVCFPLINER